MTLSSTGITAALCAVGLSVAGSAQMARADPGRTFSGTNGRIAYSAAFGNANDETYSPTSTNTFPVAPGTNCEFSPDGKKLATASNDGNGMQGIIISDLSLNPITSYPIYLSQVAGTEYSQPRWSKDGTTLAFSIKQGTSFKLLTRNVTAPATPGPVITLVSTSVGAIAGPSWSPDGSQIVYTQASGNGASTVIVRRSDKQRQTVASEADYAGLAQWHPTDQRISYGTYDPNTGATAVKLLEPNLLGVWTSRVISTQGTKPSPLVQPVWSADGSKLLWARDSGLRELVVATRDLLGIYNPQIVGGATGIVDAVFAPSGTRILYSTTTAIFTIPVGGGTPTLHKAVAAYDITYGRQP